MVIFHSYVKLPEGNQWLSMIINVFHRFSMLFNDYQPSLTVINHHQPGSATITNHPRPGTRERLIDSLKKSQVADPALSVAIFSGPVSATCKDMQRPSKREKSGLETCGNCSETLRCCKMVFGEPETAWGGRLLWIVFSDTKHVPVVCPFGSADEFCTCLTPPVKLCCRHSFKAGSSFSQTLAFCGGIHLAAMHSRLCLGICFGCTFHLWQTHLAIGDSVHQPEAAGMTEAMVPVIQRSQPPRPQVPRRFSADMRFVSYDPAWAYLPIGFPPAIGQGVFACDADAKAMSIRTMRHFPGMEQLVTNITYLYLENSSHHILGGRNPVCREIHLSGQKSYSDLFSWAANPHLSEYIGQKVVAGRACSLWNLRSKNQSKMSLCAAGNVPVELNITYPKNDGSSFNVSYQFGPLSSQVSEHLQKPHICDRLAPGCENGRNRGPVSLDAYIFHPAGEYNLEDQDVGDLTGDALFICVDRLQNKSFMDHNYTLISRYALEISPAFGQYALCNGYPPPVLVGIHAWWAATPHRRWGMVRAGVLLRTRLASGSLCRRVVVVRDKGALEKTLGLPDAPGQCRSAWKPSTRIACSSMITWKSAWQTPTKEKALPELAAP